MTKEIEPVPGAETVPEVNKQLMIATCRAVLAKIGPQSLTNLADESDSPE